MVSVTAASVPLEITKPLCLFAPADPADRLRLAAEGRTMQAGSEGGWWRRERVVAESERKGGGDCGRTVLGERRDGGGEKG